MVFQSLASDATQNFLYQLNVCHLYGNLLNTYGDNGNILMLKYVGEKMNVHMNFEIVSLGDHFNSDYYDLAFFGGGQDYEQFIVSQDIQNNKEEITAYINADKPLLAVCGGYQLLGEYYIEASGRRIEGIHAMPHYTLNQDHNRFIGDIEIYNEEFDETYYGFENHQGRTFLGEGEKPLGMIKYGQGNNNEDGTEGVHYKNVFGTYFHGPILSRNARLAYRLIKLALVKKYGDELKLPKFEEILVEEISSAVNDRKRKAEIKK